MSINFDPGTMGVSALSISVLVQDEGTDSAIWVGDELGFGWEVGAMDPQPARRTTARTSTSFFIEISPLVQMPNKERCRC